MPVYEFLCPSCQVVFNFHSSRIDTETVPACPRCKNTAMKRQLSAFTALPKGEEIEQERMLKSFDSLLDKVEASEMSGAQMAGALADFGRSSGSNFTDEIEGAIGRLEDGENPQVVEKELGNLLGEDSFSFDKGIVKIVQGGKKIEVDETLYDLYEV